MRVPAKPISLDDALEVTRTGDVWLFRGRAVADRAIQISTNSPINHVGMSVALDDLPPLMWHAELGRSLPDRLYLTVLVLWVPVYLAMYRHLERTRPAPALVGSALGTLGLGVLAAGAIPHAATSRLSDLYHATGATAEDRATLVLVWQGTQGVFDALLLAGLLLTATGIVLLGVAMHTDPAFGKGAARLRHRRARRRDNSTHRSQVVGGRAWHLRTHRLPPHPRVEGLPTVQTGLIDSRPMAEPGTTYPVS